MRPSEKFAVHLAVPSHVKATWVRASQAQGQKLTEYLLSKMNVFPIPNALEAKYHGAGYALAASAGGVLVGLVYLADVLPGSIDTVRQALAAIDDPRLGPTVRELQALGQVHVGMCSCGEFVEL